MAIIKKKTWQPWFGYVKEGKKNYDLRLNDFDVSEGDTLILEEWDPKTQTYTGDSITRKVTYVGKFKMDELFWPEELIKEKGLQVISLE